jgi:uncharacterized DUF497 family protein
MDFEWDEQKRKINIGKHGLDFADVAHMDWENATILPDDRFSYGERRFWASPCSTAASIWSRSPDAQGRSAL